MTTTTIVWENICEKCNNPVNIVIKTHCCSTLQSLLIYYNEFKSLDVRNNEFVEGTLFCKGCIQSPFEIMNRQLGNGRMKSRSLTQYDIEQWMKAFNDHFDRDDCLLNLPDEITLKIHNLGNLKIRDPLYEINFNHVLYIRGNDDE